MHDAANVRVGNQVSQTFVVLDHERKLRGQGMIRRRNRPSEIFRYLDRKRFERGSLQQRSDLLFHEETHTSKLRNPQRA